MMLVFIGPPGAGKGTQAQKVVDHTRILHLSTGDMLRAAVKAGTRVGKLANEYLSSGQLVPDPIILQIVGERLAEPDCEAGCLFDGFPRTLTQARALDESLAQRGTPLAAVLELRVDDDELVGRLAARGRDDDKPEVVRRRLKTYHEQTAPLVGYYEEQGILRPIDGTGTPDEVFLRIAGVLDALVSN